MKNRVDHFSTFNADAWYVIVTTPGINLRCISFELLHFSVHYLSSRISCCFQFVDDQISFRYDILLFNMPQYIYSYLAL